MNYLYDILLNFNIKLFDIFEWEKTDNIFHIRKIPIFKIKSKNLCEIINYKVKFSEDFLSKIYKKTEYFCKNKINNIDYAFLITDGKGVVAVKMHNNKLSYSKLLYEEEEEVIDYSYGINLTNIDYTIISKNNISSFKTRNEIIIRNYIMKEIKKMIIDNDLDKLKYMYLECFNNIDINDVQNTIYIELENRWDEVYLNVYNFLKKTLQRH